MRKTGGLLVDYREERMLRLMNGVQNPEESEYNAVVPVVDFEFSQTGDPVKDRKRNIKRAIKALKPVRRWIGIPFITSRWKYAEGHRCVVDGADCSKLDYGDLFDVYFRDPVTKTIRPFRPWTGVLPGRGEQMNGTYCPQHMQLYHLLNQWIEQDSADNDRGFFRAMKRKGVSFVPIVMRKKENMTPLMTKWNEAFLEAQKDGIPIVHYRNPITNEVDITMLVFDNRQLKTRFEHGTTLAGGEYVADGEKE